MAEEDHRHSLGLGTTMSLQPADSPRHIQPIDQLFAYLQRFSGVAVISSVLLAVVAIAPTIGLVLYELAVCPHESCGRLPHDFPRVGTISNVAQDMMSPHGRCFFGFMLLSSLTLFSSQFPFWLPRLGKSDDRWLVVTDGRHRFVWLFAGSLPMACVSIIPSQSDAEGLNLVLTMLHMGGFLVCMGTLLGCEIRQLHKIEKAFHRWEKFPWLSTNDLPADEPLRQVPLDWDQRLRCSLIVGAIGSFATLVTLQAPLTTFGYSSFKLACGSVIAECCVGACVYGDLVVMAIHRTRRAHLESIAQGDKKTK